MSEKIVNNPKILGLDVSTKTIGIALFDIDTKELLELTHVSPKPKPEVENKLEELILKANMFRSKLKTYASLNIRYVIIEEPLLNSNNAYTIGTLLRFNTLIFREVYDVLGVAPEFITTYDSRKNAFPELYQKNDKGKSVLFGAYPKDVDKKMVIWELVSRLEPQIQWLFTKNNTLKKENFDSTDAYCCALGFLKKEGIWV